MAPLPSQTVSQKSRTGFRFALTDVSRAGTVLVRLATAWTPPVVATSVFRIALRWKMTRSRPTAVIAMISAAMISVAQAAAGMTVLLIYICSVLALGEELGDGTGVTDRADRDRLDGGVGDGQRLRHAVQFPDEGHPAGEDVVGGGADPFHRRQDAVEQEDDHRQHHEQQNRVAYPPQDHDWLSFCLAQLAGWYGIKKRRKTRLRAISAARRPRVNPLAGVAAAAAICSADSPRSIRSIRSCMFAEKSRISTAVTSAIMPRPYCAAAPDSCRSWATPILVPRPARVSVAVTTMLAWPRPFSSAPLACTTTRLAASSRSVMSAVPANCRRTGPIRTATLPLYFSSPRSSVSSAPGRHAATWGMFSKNSQTFSTGSATSNSFLISIGSLFSR